jgi:serine/threonine-protein kinase
MGTVAPPPPPPSQSAGAAANKLATPATRLAVLLFTDIVGSTQLKSTLGTAVYTRLLQRHNELFDAGLRECPGAQSIKHTGDGYFASFTTASDAVRFALKFQARMGIEPWDPRPLKTRVGIHIGEVALVDMAGRADVIGFSADVAARIMSLAMGGQILLTMQAFNDARQFVNHAPEVLKGAPPLRWVAHGPYLFKGGDDPMEVFEVGIEGFSPLTKPADSDKVKRVVPHDREATLGWRPAMGLDIPDRPGWVLEKKLGDGGFGEVWLGHHGKIRDRRVFKFCFDADRLRSLKRELTLFRLMREALGDRDDVATLYDVKLDEPPFFLESEYTAGGNLADWAERRGGIATLPVAQRLDLAARVADAVGAAHSLGILHKDIKPSNILIHENQDGTITPRLADFGIGILADPSRLKDHAITATGFTQDTASGTLGSGTSTGTPMYAPPESMLNKPFTTHGDVFALGVLVYQLAIGDLSKPLATGWDADIEDPVLRADIAEMVQGDPARRISAALGVSKRLRSLDQRRAELAKQRELEAALRRRKRIARVSFAAAIALVVLILGGGSVAWLHIQSIHREQAKTELNRKEAQRNADESKVVTRFLIDMFHTADPSISRGRQITVADFVNQAVTTLDGAIPADQPLVKARLQDELGNVLFALGEFARAQALQRQALDTRRKLLGDDHPDTLTSMVDEAKVLRLNKPAEAVALAKDALDRRRRISGDRDPDTLAALDNYASALRSNAQYDQALPLAKEAYDLRKAVLGAEDPDTLASLTNYATTLRQLDRFDQAEAPAKEAYEARKKRFTDDHPDTLQSLSNYASIVEGLGRLADAQALYKQAWDARRRVLGDAHLATIYSAFQFANVCLAQNHPDETLPIARRALEDCRPIDTTGRVTPRLLDLLARTLITKQQFSDAEPLSRECLDLIRKSPTGPRTPEARKYAATYTRILKSLHRDQDATAIANEFTLPAASSTRPTPAG